MTDSGFTVDVDQNQYLPEGGRDVSAVVTVTSGADVAVAAPAGGAGSAEIIIIDCSGSMDYPPTKMTQARAATAAAINVVRDGVGFAVIAGTSTAWPVFPPDGRMAVASASTRAAAKQAVNGPAGQRRHRDRPVARAGPADLRGLPGATAARHLAHRRQEPARDACPARGRARPVRGGVQLRLPRRGHRLGGQRAAHGLHHAARHGGHRAGPGRAGRRLRGHDGERDGQAGRRRVRCGCGRRSTPRSSSSSRWRPRWRT